MAYKIKICKSLYAALVLNLVLIQLSEATVFPMKRLTCTINPVPPNNILLREFWIKIKSNWKNKTLPNNILKGSRLQVIHNYLAPTKICGIFNSLELLTLV